MTKDERAELEKAMRDAIASGNVLDRIVAVEQAVRLLLQQGGK